MSATIAEHQIPSEINFRARISDPVPARCSGCMQSAGAGQRFVNLDMRINRGTICQEGTIAVLERIDELHLCDACVRDAAEALEYVPELHQRHVQLNRMLMRERDELREQNRQLRAMLAES